jgi:MFS family permease
VDLTSERKAWAVMLAVFLASVAVAASRFKVPPSLPTLMADLGLSMAAGGWLMSIFSVNIIVLAIPAALILGRLGPRITGLAALGCSLAGSVGGALAPSAGVLLAARTVEGVGLAVMAVVAPSVISLWFRPEARGLPMGIWVTWVPLGSVIMFNVAQPLETIFGWRAIWWFSAVLTLVAAVVYALVVTLPPRNGPDVPPPTLPTGSTLRALLNPSLGLLALAFALFAFTILGYNTWAPSYLSSALGIDARMANLYTSLMFIAAIPANIFAGWLLDRTRHGTILLSTSFLLTSLLFFWSFRLGSLRLVAPYMLALGSISNILPPGYFALAPESVNRPDPGRLGPGRREAAGAVRASLALAAILAGSNVGALAGPPVLGALLSSGPWTWGSTCLVIVAILGTIVTFVAGQTMRQRDRNGAVHRF